jgi:hypothetical protein
MGLPPHHQTCISVALNVASHVLCKEQQRLAIQHPAAATPGCLHHPAPQKATAGDAVNAGVVTDAYCCLLRMIYTGHDI